MRKVDFILVSADSNQNLARSLVENCLAEMVVRLKPTSLEDSPYNLCNIKMWTVRRQEKDIETFFLPSVNVLCDTSLPMYGRIVKYHECRFGY